MNYLAHSLTVAALATTFATGQTADSLVFGQACVTAEGQANISTPELPQLGSFFGIEYSGPNHTFDPQTQTSSRPYLVLGFDRLNAQIPTSLFFNQPAGCEISTTHDVIVPMAAVLGLGSYEAGIKVDLPAHTALLGVEIFAQWYVVNRRCTPQDCVEASWIGTSDALWARIGL